MTTISSVMSGMSAYGGMGAMHGRMERGGGKPDFSKIDADGSGGLDQTELQAMPDKGPKGASRASGTQSVSTEDLFSQLDTDSDGSVSESELKSGMRPPADAMGMGAGAAQGGWAAMGMDTQSFAGMMGGMGGGMNGMQAPPPPPPGGGPGGPSGAQSIGQAISSLDSDDDDQISASEFGLSDTESDSQLQALFDTIDSDQDGQLSTTEVSQFDEQIKTLLAKFQQFNAMNADQFDQAASSWSVTA